jgi:protein O-GlcNAc transferase
VKAERSDFEGRLDMSILSYQQFLEANPLLRFPFDGLGNVEDQVGCLEGRVESWY